MSTLGLTTSRNLDVELIHAPAVGLYGVLVSAKCGQRGLYRIFTGRYASYQAALQVFNAFAPAKKPTSLYPRRPVIYKLAP